MNLNFCTYINICKKCFASKPQFRCSGSLHRQFYSVKKVKIIPGRETLVSDIPAGDSKTAKFFLQCRFLDIHCLQYYYYSCTCCKDIVDKYGVGTDVSYNFASVYCLILVFLSFSKISPNLRVKDQRIIHSETYILDFTITKKIRETK